MANVLVGGIYVVQATRDDKTEYWAAATIQEKAVVAVEKELGPGWTVTLTDRRLTGSATFHAQDESQHRAQVVATEFTNSAGQISRGVASDSAAQVRYIATAAFVGLIHAPSKASALRTAIKEFNIRPEGQKRLPNRPRWASCVR